MDVSLIDLLVVAGVGYGVWRGWHRGLPAELPRVLGLVVFGVSGTGLIRWTSQVLAETRHLTGQATGAVGTVGLMVGAWLLVRLFRTKIGDWAKQRWGEAKGPGAIAGGLRTLLLACVALLILAHWPLHSLTRPVTENSRLGRALLRYVLPEYVKTHRGPL